MIVKLKKKGNRTERRVALYARVSTLNNGQSPEMQLRELQEHCERRGWEISGEYDSGISGATATASPGGMTSNGVGFFADCVNLIYRRSFRSSRVSGGTQD
jgi:resolvase-like protein